MEIVDYLLARKKAGGGSDVTIEQLSVTENGTYSEEGIAYSPVVVNVPAPENSYQLKNLPTGTVSTIEDGTDLPMSSLKVGMEPVQDLHGYDSPWVGGAGKNLFDIDAEHTSGTGTYMYEVYVKPNTSYTLSTNCPYSSPASLYFNGGSTEINGVGDGRPKTFSSDENGKLTIYVRNAASGAAINLYTAVKNGQYYVQLEEGSTATSYEPYSNICPISGWTEANVTRCGKNLWNTADITSIFVGTITRNGLYFRKPGQYTVSAQNSGNYLYCRVFNADGTIKETYNIVSMSTITNATFTISDGEYFAVYDAMESSIDISKTRFNSWLCQVEKGTTATTYEPYNGQTYNVQFHDGDNPLTVYGGTLDVTTGELAVDRKLVNMGNLSWAYDTSYDRFASNNIPDSESPSGARITSFISSIYEVIDDGRPLSQVTSGQMYSSFDSTQTSAIVMVHDNRFTDATEFKTAVTGQTFTYELATPTTYHLTPTQIRTLVGNNNIWADTGDVLSGKYFKEL